MAKTPDLSAQTQPASPPAAVLPRPTSWQPDINNAEALPAASLTWVSLIPLNSSASNHADAAEKSFRETLRVSLQAYAAATGNHLTPVDGEYGDGPGVRIEIAPGLEPAVSVCGQHPDNHEPGPGDTLLEAYEIEIAASGVVVRATHAEGVFRALTTLGQLAASAPLLPAGLLRDAPRYAWRGLSLDVVRHFADAAEVRRITDVLAAHKLNVLHLHLTDNQGWRFEVPGWPRLTQDCEHYTRKELRELVAYAAERFVRIVPEMDMQGTSAQCWRHTLISVPLPQITPILFLYQWATWIRISPVHGSSLTPQSPSWPRSRRAHSCTWAETSPSGWTTRPTRTSSNGQRVWSPTTASGSSVGRRPRVATCQRDH
nr:family 20 glycosylhydrolase [Actinomyces ruminis]